MNDRFSVLSCPFRWYPVTGDKEDPEAGLTMSSEIKGLTDEELMTGVRDGNKDCFSELVGRHTPRFYRLAYRMTSNREEAEDIVQESFLAVWTKPASWDEDRKAKFTTWFYRIVANACIDRKRKPATLPLDDGYDPPAPGGTAEEIVEMKRTKEDIEAHVSSLPGSQRLALALCFYEGVTNREAADIMGVSVKALESLLMRAKGSLRTKLGIYRQKEARHG